MMKLIFLFLLSVTSFATLTPSGGSSSSGNATSIQSIPVSATSPTNNQCLVSTGTTWAPGSCSSGSGTVTSIQVAGSNNISCSGGPVTGSGTITCTGTLLAPKASPVFTGTIGTALADSVAVVTDSGGNLATAATTATEVGYVHNVTSAIQTQLNAKAPTASPTFTGTVTGTFSGGLTGNVTGFASAYTGFVDDGGIIIQTPTAITYPVIGYSSVSRNINSVVNSCLTGSVTVEFKICTSFGGAGTCTDITGCNSVTAGVTNCTGAQTLGAGTSLVAIISSVSTPSMCSIGVANFTRN